MTKKDIIQNKKICVLGLGYMGLPLASLLTNSGSKVFGIDVDINKIKDIKNKKIALSEPGLKEIVIKAFGSGNFEVSNKMAVADVYIIAVPTPIKKNKKADLSFVLSASNMIKSVLKNGDLVILESTVPPNTCKKILIPMLEKSGLKAGKDFYFSHCPERAIPGNTLYELINNDRIIGGIDDKSTKLTSSIYESFVKGSLLETDITTAEMVKLMENTSRDVNIALANEFAKIAEDNDVNVWEAINLANRHPRVKILKPGPGVGGHCIAVDPWFLIEKNKKGYPVIYGARLTNDSMPKHVVELAKKYLKDARKPKISILGVSYKANVDDPRESPALEIIKLAKLEGWKVFAHDYYVKNIDDISLFSLNECLYESDCIILVTDHNDYLSLKPNKIKNLVKTPIMIDTRNFLDQGSWKGAGFTVQTLGSSK